MMAPPLRTLAVALPVPRFKNDVLLATALSVPPLKLKILEPVVDER